jgi:glycosyltransferase involved in cell wall biosynthesis
MLCGCPVILSDKVGAGYDLVRHGENGFIYPCGDLNLLAEILKEVLPDRNRLKNMGIAATDKMQTWTPENNVEAIVKALEKFH